MWNVQIACMQMPIYDMHMMAEPVITFELRDLLYVAVCFVVVYAPIMCELALCVCRYVALSSFSVKSVDI